MSSFAKATAAFAGAAVLVIASASTAGAQGKGNAWGRGRSGSPSAASAPAPSQQGGADEGAGFFVPAGAGVRNFGAWLDDSSVVAPGAGWATVSFGYWRTPLAREIDVPMIDGGVGLTSRVQVGFSAPVYHVGEPGGPMTRGLGDLYFNAKIQLRDPSTSSNGVGFAIIPVLEILSFQPGPDESRVQWALPASVEVQREGWRAFGTAGYFSRGALFAAAGGELALSDRAWLVGAITQSHSADTDNLSAALGLAKTRTDVSAGLTISAMPAVALFGSVGRTISRRDDNSASLSATVGVSYSFTAWAK
jgi:hypothetical protein